MRIEGLEREVSAEPGAALAQTRERVAALRALERERAQLQAVAKQGTGPNTPGLQGTNRGLRETMVELRTRIDRLERSSGVTCPLCGQPLDEAGRAALIASLQQEGSAQGDRWRGNEQRMRALAAESEQRRARVAQLDDELASAATAAGARR